MPAAKSPTAIDSLVSKPLPFDSLLVCVFDDSCSTSSRDKFKSIRTVAHPWDGHAPGPVNSRLVDKQEVIPKRAPEELIVILLLPGWAGVGSRDELPVCGGGFRLAAVPVHRNGGKRFLRTVPWSIRRDRESVRFYGRWR